MSVGKPRGGEGVKWVVVSRQASKQTHLEERRKDELSEQGGKQRPGQPTAATLSLEGASRDVVGAGK